MSKDDNVYRELQEHLDTLPIGFPATKSGVEIRILKSIFNPEEAHIAKKLKFDYEPIEIIYERVDKSKYSLEGLRKILDTMVDKGGLHYKKVDGKKLYANAVLMVGMYEYQVKRLTKEFVEDVFQYAREGFALEAFSTGINQLRIIPVEESIEQQNIIGTYDELKEIVQSCEGPFCVVECICRKAQDLLGEPCKVTKNRENCMVFGEWAQMNIELGRGREIKRAEALEILRQNEQDGLILEPINSQKPGAICSCCACCCGLIRGLKGLHRPVDLAVSNYYAQVNSERCIGCETCIDRCQMEALQMVEGVSQVNRDRCIGCGNCVSTCPEEALCLQQKEITIIPPKTVEDLYISIKEKKEPFLQAKLKARERKKKKELKKAS